VLGFTCTSCRWRRPLSGELPAHDEALDIELMAEPEAEPHLVRAEIELPQDAACLQAPDGGLADAEPARVSVGSRSDAVTGVPGKHRGRDVGSCAKLP
jgi:hypothetical protein